MELGRVQEPGGGNIEKEDLHEGKIITLSNVLSKDECEQRIARAENVGFNPSPVSGGGHGRTGKEDPRTSEFVVFVDGKVFLNFFQSVLLKFFERKLEGGTEIGREKSFLLYTTGRTYFMIFRV